LLNVFGQIAIFWEINKIKKVKNFSVLGDICACNGGGLRM
jgi:hypothetical protein